ncbi:MAG: 30S ribosomal protein S27ae [Candidatus Micrarchaeaceae archaeon]
MAEEKKKIIKPYKPGKFCPKCGSRMAEHSDRYTCGKCHYTEWKSNQKAKQDGSAEAKKAPAK